MKRSRTRTSILNPSKNRAGELPALDSERKKQLAAFQKTAGFRFRSLELLSLSFMHRSVSNESSSLNREGCKINNERLEFLGDAILGAVCATVLYQKYAEKPEGELAKIKSVAVSEEVLSGVARDLQIDNMLLLGKGEELSGGRTKKAILADAVIGALYLDSGYKAASAFVSGFLVPEIDRVAETDYHRDYKSLLQELCQHFFRSYPNYQMVKRSGPEHERLFWIEVTVNGKVYGPGTGRNKKSAEQEAARMAYEGLTAEQKAGGGE